MTQSGHSVIATKMGENSDKRRLLEDIGLSLVAIAIWAAVCFGIVWLFPSASWVWYLFWIYAALTIFESLFDFSAMKIVRRILEPAGERRK